MKKTAIILLIFILALTGCQSPAPTATPDPAPTPTAEPAPLPAYPALDPAKIKIQASAEFTDHPAALALDGDASTFWKGRAGTAQWLRLDLGQPALLGTVELDWAQNPPARLELQISDDPYLGWRTLSKTNPNGAQTRLDFPPAMGRYLRLDLNPDNQPVDGTALAGIRLLAAPNLAKGQPAQASSISDPPPDTRFLAEHATDSDPASRWASSFADNQWLLVDLGNAQHFNHVILRWEAYGKQYQVQSGDSASGPWTTLVEVTNGDGGVDELGGFSTTARYLRLNLQKRGTEYGFSLWEVEVYQLPETQSAAPPSLPSGTTLELHVNASAANADDSNPGTADQPIATINRAAQMALQAKAAGTSVQVWIHPGVYRETVQGVYTGEKNGAAITFAATDPGQAILSGSALWNDEWQPYLATPLYVHPWPYDWGLIANPWESYNVVIPELTRRTEAVYINGVLLQQVLKLDDLTPGAFYVSESDDQLFVYPPTGIDLPTARVEVAIYENLFRLDGLDHLTISGLVFQHARGFFGSGLQTGDNASDVLVKNSRFEWNGGYGLQLNAGENITVRNVIASHNGVGGLRGDQVRNLIVEDTEASYNNWRGNWGGFNDWHPGQKFMGLREATFRRYRAEGNFAAGLWLDYDNANVTIENSTICGNLLVGLYIEGSHDFTVRDNVICNNLKKPGDTYHTPGLFAPASANVTLERNLIFNNSEAQLGMSEPAERPIENWETGETYTLRTQNWIMRDNIIVANAGQLLLQDRTSPYFVDTLTAENNRYWSVDSSPFLLDLNPDPALSNPEKIDFAAWQERAKTDATSQFAPPPWQGLVGYWKFNEKSGEAAADSSGLGHDARVNKAAWANGHSAGGLAFIGDENYAQITNDESLNITGQITLSAWVRPTANDARYPERNILTHGYTLSPNREVFLRIKDGQYQVGTWTDTTTVAASAPMLAEDVDTWVHLVGTYDGVAWRLYRNGQLLAIQPDANGAIAVDADWFIGGLKTEGGVTRIFRGRIDEVRLYNRAISPEEVADLFAGTRYGEILPKEIVLGDQKPYQGAPLAIPGRIEAEDFNIGPNGDAYLDTTPGNEGGQMYRSDKNDVDIKPSAYGGYSIGWFINEEALNYFVDVKQEGMYQITLFGGSGNTGRQMHIEFNGVNVTGAVTIPGTPGEWDTYTGIPIGPVYLKSGEQLMSILCDLGFLDVDWIEFRYLGPKP
jgi:parallel beta-helix repeat protein